MRLNTEQIEVPENPELFETLVDILSKKPRPMAILETGTFHGTGTTALVIKAATRAMYENPHHKFRPLMYTIEASERNYLIARNNLREYPWVQVMHGCSLDLKECEEFIKADKAILEHENWPDILIDSLDPVDFYLKEINGKLFGPGRKGKDNLLLRLMPEIWNKRPLFVLDSAGGIGYLEFQKVVEYMQNSRYFVFLDDALHLKHFRSVAYIRQCDWPILYENERCMVALHPGSPGRPTNSLTW